MKKEEKKGEVVEVLEEDSALSWVNNCFAKAETFRSLYDESFVAYYKLWRALSDDVASTYRSTWQSALGTEVIESVLPKIINTNIKIEFLAQEESDKDSEKTNNALMEWQWSKSRADKYVRIWVKNMLIYGTAHMKLIWCEDDGMPKLIPLDIDSVYWDPTATNVDDARYMIHKKYVSIADLKENKNYDQKQVKLLEKELSEKEKKENNDATTPDTLDIQRLAAHGISGETAKPIRLLECWGDYDGKASLVVVANGKYLLRNDKNPYKHGKKPFIKIVAMDVPNEYCGRGLMEIIKPDVDRHTTIVRQFQDNASRINNKMWKVRRGSGVKRTDLVSRPNGVIEVGQPDDLTELLHTPLSGDLYKEEENILTRIRNLIGLLDNDAPNVTKTATGMSILQESSNERARIMTKIIEDDGLVEIGEMWLALNKQYLTKDVVIRITGNTGTEWKTITPAEIKTNFDISVVAGSQLPQNKQARLTNFMAYYNESVNNPLINQIKLEQIRADLFGQPVDIVNSPEKVVQAGGIQNGQGISPSITGQPSMEGVMQGLGTSSGGAPQ